jgi:16S rRNA (guanine527-N7)-methyltransferase
MEQFKKYTQLLLQYNKIHRLSGAKNSTEVEANIEDSLYPSSFIDFSTLSKVVDIGTGAGFPGMILAIAHPHIHFTLVEPLMKRTAFLHLVKSTYDLKNVTIEAARIEDVTPFDADLITSRAVAKTDFLLELSQNFIAPHTRFLFYKGEGVFDEVDESMEYEIVPRGKRNYLYIKRLS